MRRHWLRVASSGSPSNWWEMAAWLAISRACWREASVRTRVEAKWRKVLVGAGFVGGGEEILLGDGEVVFGRRRSGRGAAERR